MPAIYRRTFLQRLNLGAGALLLGPSLGRWVKEAHGATTTRKRLFLMVQGNGMNYNSFAPPGHEPRIIDALGTSKLYDAPVTTVPQMFEPIAPYKDRFLYVDGLSNFIGEDNHTLGYCALTCLPGIGNTLGPPGGPSFDQVMAQSALGQGQVFPSILLGPYAGNGDRALMNTVFATGRDKPAPQFAWATAAYDQTIAKVGVGQGPGASAAFDRRKKLLDFLRDDVRRANASLGSAEKVKLDQLLASVDALDTRMTQLAQRAQEARESLKLGPITAEPEAVEDRSDLCMQIAATALGAGLTNIIGYSATARAYVVNWRKLGLQKNSHTHGHGETEGKPIHPLIMVHQFYGQLLLRTMKALDSVPEGDGTMLDNTIIVWLSDQAEQHHPFVWRWPALVIAKDGSKSGNGLRTGGRFVRYPLARRPGSNDALRKRPTRDMVRAAKAPGGRSLADLFITLSHALGAPADTFGTGGTEEVKGALPELLA